VWLLIASLATAAIPAAASAQRSETVRGRVVNDSGRGVAASVIVTRGPDRLVQRTTTDSNGNFSLVFDPGTGDYLIHASAPGLRAVRRRVTRTGDARVLSVDLTLAPDLTVLSAIRVTAQRVVRPSAVVRPTEPEAGTSERWKEGVAGQLPPGLAGDLAAIASTTPGISMTGAGPSVLGAPADANLVTLNGMSAALARIPRSANVETRVTTTTYDPSRGGFSGANIDVRLAAGNRNVQERRAHLSAAPSGLASPTSRARASGVPANLMNASVGADGELIRRALSYNVALEATRSDAADATLFRAGPVLLGELRVPADSVSALEAVVGANYPATLGALPPRTSNTAVGWLGRLDDTRDSLQSRTLTTYLSWDRRQAIGAGSVAQGSATGLQDNLAGGAQVVLTALLGSDRRILTETRLAGSRSGGEARSGFTLPQAIVMLRGDKLGSEGASSVLIGSGILPSSERTWNAEAANETQWYRNGRRHRYKVSLWGRADGVSGSAPRDALGTYQFNSLADYATGKPSRFTRSFGVSAYGAAVANMAGSVSHQFAPSSFFSMLWGGRLEASRALRGGANDAAVESLLDVRTGLSGTRVHVSPRAGFTYVMNRARDNTGGLSVTGVGRYHRQPVGVLRGGVGEFRGLLRPGTLAFARGASREQVLDCVGSEAPPADWSAFAQDQSSIPTRCAGAGSGLEDRAEYPRVVDRSYDMPRSWRASLDWTTSVRSLSVRIAGLGSYDLNQPSIIDPNFSGRQQFQLANDASRPVYAPETAWDARTATVSSVGSRLAPSLGTVDLRTSDLRGHASQASVTVAPDVYKFRSSSQLYASLSYTLQHARRQYRGFDGAAFGDPRSVEWAPSNADVRHVALVSGGFSAPKVGTLTLFARSQSGLPYTPIVQGDVNGDGHYGDRASLSDALLASDPDLARQLASVRASAPGPASNCLERAAAPGFGRNACQSNWTTTLNMQWRPALPLAWRRQVTAGLYVQNVLNGLDRLLHSSDDRRGWGDDAATDPVLLIPRRFDAVTRQIFYDVNPRFGRPMASRASRPFGIILDVAIDWSVDFDLQQLRRASEPVRTATGWKQRDATAFTAFYLARTSSIHRFLIRQSDSLFLAPSQVAALEAADSAFSSRVRMIYQPLGSRLADAGDAIEADELALVQEAQRAYWATFWEQPEIAEQILTPAQRDLMPLLKGLLGVPAVDRQLSQSQFGNPVTPAHPSTPPRS